jgi:hypothetical protein
MTTTYSASRGRRPDTLAEAASGPLRVRKLVRMVRLAEQNLGVAVRHTARIPCLPAPARIISGRG